MNVITDGVLDTSKLWTPTDKNLQIRRSPAPNRLRVGGTGSSKSSDSLMECITNYLLRWDGCAGLFLRRNLSDLKKSSILDLHSFVPNELYEWNGTDHIATFFNGSKLFFGHLPNNSEKDLQKYLSAAFPVIVMDECGQFSSEAYFFMQTRNRINRECQKNERGEFPVPVMLGNTNPIGPHWGFYKKVFVQKKPLDPPEGARRDKNGCWWIETKDGWELLYNPADWDFVHSTLLDNPYLMERDPGLLAKLKKLPTAMREKLLEGYLDSAVGQFFDCWVEDLNVVDLGKDPEAVIWQPWQPRWIGWDWGRAHWTSIYWFTFALVRGINGEYSTKVVCYREYVDRGKNYDQLVDNIARMTQKGIPGHETATSIRAVFFSHEKFNKEFDEPQSPAMIITAKLMDHGLPGVTRATTNRIGRAALMYNQIETRKLAVLSTCTEIIDSIPMLVRDEKHIEDVLKLDTKADDCYDGFAYGLFGWLSENSKPDEEKLRDKLATIDDPLQKRLEQMKWTLERDKAKRSADESQPHWY